MFGDETKVEARVGLILPSLIARMLTPAELTFAIEMALSEGEANRKLLAYIEAAIETKIANRVDVAAAG